MNEETLSALAEFLTDGISASGSEVPAPLADTEYVRETVSAPSRCPQDGCSARVHQQLDSGEDNTAFEVVCKRGHDTAISREAAAKVRFQPEPTMTAIAAHLKLDPGDEDWIDCHLPRYVEAMTGEGISLCLIADPHKYAETIRDVLYEAVERQRPTILLTPRKTADEIIQIAESYPLGSLVTPLPLELLNERDEMTEIIAASRSALEMEELVFEKRELGDDELARKLSQRPRLIEAYLNYIRILREDETSRYTLGEQMETVCKAAFMALDCRLRPEFGGTESRGTSIPDIVFQLPYHSDEEKSQELRPVLAIVDAKSGSDANFEDEDIIGKHRDYIRYAKEQEVFAGYDLTHVFVAFDIDDYNEIDWYDGIESVYRKHTGMVVLHADALLLLVRIAQSAPMRNEIGMSAGAFEDFIRPFFQRRLFTDEDAYPHVATMTRFDHVDDLTKRQEEYRRDYQTRPGLLVVTGQMVQRRFADVVDRDGIEPVLEQYGESG